MLKIIDEFKTFKGVLLAVIVGIFIWAIIILSAYYVF